MRPVRYAQNSVTFKYQNMKKAVILLSILALTLSACSTQPKGEDGATQENRKTGRKIRTESDSLSYAVGIDLSNHLKNNIQKNVGSDFNIDMALAAIKDAMDDKYTLTTEESYAFLQEYFSVRLPERKKAEGEAFLADVERTNPAVQKTESGLLYEIINPGSDVRPADMRDQVRVMYRGALKDGTEFDSSYERGDTAKFALNGVIKGWGEGLQLIGEGGQIKLWIPSELGYGAYGGGPIGPNEPLVFDVELIEVIPAN